MISTDSVVSPHNPSVPNNRFNGHYAPIALLPTQTSAVAAYHHQNQNQSQHHHHQRKDSAVDFGSSSKTSSRQCNTASARASRIVTTQPVALDVSSPAAASASSVAATYASAATALPNVSSSAPYTSSSSFSAFASAAATTGGISMNPAAAMAPPPLPRASMQQTMYANGVASTAASYNKGANNQPVPIAADNAFIDAGSDSNSKSGFATDAAAIAVAAAAAAAAATATNPTTLGANSTSGPLVAPRPVSAHQLNPPPWLFATLPLDVLLGLAAPNQKQKIINDVFLTPEERYDSPQLTPVSYIEDTRMRPLVLGDGLESMDPMSDLALFADPQAAEARSEWDADEIETTSVCSTNTRQPSPTPTVISEHNGGDDGLFSPIGITSPVSGVVAITGCSAADGSGTADVEKFNLSSSLSAHVAQSKTQYSCVDPETASLSGESCVDSSVSVPAAVRESLRPTIFEELSNNGVDWCRYCGTTEGINWRPGPWGKRTLCNKHGCDYKGYGFASKMPRLNLKSFADETLDERTRPVLQTYCQICQQDYSESENVLTHCDGCHRAYHQCCHPDGIADSDVRFDSRWFCEPSCRDNARKRRIIVELPKCRLPFMCSSRHTNSNSSSLGMFQTASSDSAFLRSNRALPAVSAKNTRSRKRKTLCKSPDRVKQRSESVVDRVDTSKKNGSSAFKVRKSSRVTRPSFKRLESDYTV
ncbi:hypothetical protein IW138_000647 [Coemansia sp. RSA 986]|nr:hypothetical protein IW138_000647 [Coemansia sp. RSA 986]